MATKRMVSLKIVDTDAFMDMPLSTQALYLHLAIRADDDGFVGNPKKIIKMVGGQDDDYKILIAKRFIIVFDSGVCVIKHWLIHNLIRKDRYTKTNYLKEKSQIAVKANRSYTENSKIDNETVKQIEPVKKPEWQKNRQKARKESSLPYSFDYKIRLAFVGKNCPICDNKMKDLPIEELNYNSKSSPRPSIQHNVPLIKGGKHELGNISVICRSCNTSIRDNETGELNSKEVTEVWNTIGNQSAPQYRLDKTRLDKVRLDKASIAGKPAEVIPDLLKDKQRHIYIIGIFAKAKKIVFTSKEQQGSFIRRNLRAAKNLVGYEDDRIIETLKYLILYEDFKITLDTVGKYIDEDLNKLAIKNTKTIKI